MSREASALETTGRRVLHLEVGQPSTPLPRLARQAVRDHLDAALGYTNAAGLHSLRRRLAEREGVGPERIVIVAGASAGVHLAVPHALRRRRPGRSRRAGLPVLSQCAPRARHHAGRDPGRPRQPLGADARPPRRRRTPRRVDRRLTVEPDRHGTRQRRSPRRRRHVPRARYPLIGDEIYHGIVDDSRGPAPARPRTRCRGRQQLLEVLVDDRMARRMDRRARLVWSTPSSGCSRTCTSARRTCRRSQPSRPSTRRRTRRPRRAVPGERRSLIDGLAAAGITEIAPADGAFYVYAHVPHLTTELGIDSLQLTTRWLHEVGVAATSGVDFDLARGHEYVRFSCAGASTTWPRPANCCRTWRP